MNVSATPMTKDELVRRLRELQCEDEERAHLMADRLLLEYIADHEITGAYYALDRWFD